MGTSSPSADELPELDAYDFALPEEAIAQQPIERRDAARMLVVDRNAASGSAPVDRRVCDLGDQLREGDLLVVNRTRVVAAKLRGRKRDSGGRVEALLLSSGDAPRYRALLKSSGRLRAGLELVFEATQPGGQRAPELAVAPRLELEARITKLCEGGEVELEFASAPAEGNAAVTPYDVGEPPLPPYIRRQAGAQELDRSRYQTVFADEPGAVAAPTAGLHLTEELIAGLAARGVEMASVVLHVGLGTFKPLRREDLDAGRLHRERYVLPEATAAAVRRTRERRGRVIAVGTTSTRVLESCASDGAGTGAHVEAGSGETDLFIRPSEAFPFRVVDGLLTNFHLPRSSLLLLVCAFAGRERILSAYRDAVARGYRFYSYGDAMLIL